MKKGISRWCFKESSYAEIFASAKALGFDGVEVTMDASGELTPETDEAALLEIKKKAEDAGIELYSMASSLYWSYSLSSPNEEMREKALYVAEKQIKAAAILGCNSVLIVPGAVKVDFAASLGVTGYEDAYKYALDSAKKIAKIAEEYKINVGMENVWNRFLTSPLEMKYFIDEVNSEYIGSYFDAGNVFPNGLPEEWIKVLGNRIKKVHIKDFHVGTKNFCDLLTGSVDFDAVMKALSEIGYDDFVTAEMGQYRVHNDVMLAHTSMAMDKIMGR